MLGQMAQRHIPGGVGHAIFIEVDGKQYQRLDPQLAIHQAVGATDFLVSKLGDPHHAIEDGFEVRIQHALADAPMIKKQNGF